jgi:hypothetical protein
MKLIKPTDDELNAAFAEHVVGFKPDPNNEGRWIPPGRHTLTVGYWTEKPARFTHSADAVLPWLEKTRFDANFWKRWRIQIICWETHGENKFAEADTFPRAAVIALLRANGVEVEFSPSP